MQFTTMLRNSALIASAAAFVLTLPVISQAQKPDKEQIAEFNNYYRGTKVWKANSRGDAYNKIITPGTVLTIRVPGIYADIANISRPIATTDVENGTVTHANGLISSSSVAGGPRELKPGETVFITDIKSKNDILHFEVITADQTALGDRANTRYRAEIDFHIPGLSNIGRFDDLKKIIDPVMTADPVPELAVANNAAPSNNTSPVQSKTVDIGMNTDQVKQALGNPDKIINLGAKTIFVYKDIKVVFNNSKVADVQ